MQGESMEKADVKKIINTNLTGLTELISCAREARVMGILDFYAFMNSLEFYVESLKSQIQNA